MFVFHSGQSTV